MKKTIIALIALTGVASAGTGAEFNEELQQALTEASYTLGAPFSITAKLSSIQNHNKGFVTLADNYYIVNQNHEYWGLNSSDSNNLTNNSAWTLAVSGNVYTYTSTDSTLPLLWVQNGTGTGSATRAVGAWIGVEIASDGTDSSVTLTYAGSNITDVFILKGTVLDANKIAFKDDIGSVTDTRIVPEPTTATLSLLALAGLAARRRRK